jgi:hypothetical protein
VTVRLFSANSSTASTCSRVTPGEPAQKVVDCCAFLEIFEKRHRIEQKIAKITKETFRLYPSFKRRPKAKSGLLFCVLRVLLFNSPAPAIPLALARPVLPSWRTRIPLDSFRIPTHLSLPLPQYPALT